MARRIHVMGASGSGTSTLARGLANAFDSQAFDTDDFYWKPTDPPFTEKRPVAERIALMQEVFLPRRDWILSGSFTSWGTPILPRLTHVVFLALPGAKRLARLRKRERLRADPGADADARMAGGERGLPRLGDELRRPGISGAEPRRT